MPSRNQSSCSLLCFCRSRSWGERHGQADQRVAAPDLHGRVYREHHIRRNPAPLSRRANLVRAGASFVRNAPRRTGRTRRGVTRQAGPIRDDQSSQALGLALRVARLESNGAVLDEPDIRQALADAAQGLAVGAFRAESRCSPAERSDLRLALAKLELARRPGSATLPRHRAA
jgi:hypothetical protein